MRYTKFIDHETGSTFYDHETGIKADSKVAQDETTEQVFSRKDRKAYRAEVLKQRTEASTGKSERKASTVGKKGKASSKAHS